MAPYLRGHFFLERSVGKDLLQKHPSTRWREQEDTDDPKNSPIQVGIVVDVVLSLLPLDIGINQKKATQKEARKAEYPKETDVRQRHENDTCKNGGGGSTRGPKGLVITVALLFEVGRNICNHYRNKVKTKEDQASQLEPKLIVEEAFDYPSKKVEGKHVEKKVHVILVDKTG